MINFDINQNNFTDPSIVIIQYIKRSLDAQIEGFKLSVFRAYDIRGIFGEELTPKIFYDIGLSFTELIGDAKTLSLARDVRTSSPILEYMLKSGVLSGGCNVLSLGVKPTPLLYFSIAHLDLDGGAAITASHNPPEYNGVKLCRKRGFSLTYESGIKTIENKIKSGILNTKNWKNIGKEKFLDIKPIYEQYLDERIDFHRKIRIVIDAGNGTCGFVADMLKKKGCKVDILFAEPDGRFPNHIPNPLIEETLEALKERVIEFKADLGIAFDGDGDRVGFVDEKGNLIKADQAMMIFAEDLICNDAKSKILFDVATSKAVPEYIKTLGGKSLMTRVGHSYVMETLHNEKGKMAAEISGHYYFLDDYYGFDDGIFAAFKMIEILSKRKLNMSYIIHKLPKYFSTPEERRKCPDEKKFEVIRRIKEYFESAGYKLITIDGVRLELENAWALIRASNTEPAIVLRFEGKTLEQLKNIKGIVEEAYDKSIKGP